MKQYEVREPGAGSDGARPEQEKTLLTWLDERVFLASTPPRAAGELVPRSGSLGGLARLETLAAGGPGRCEGIVLVGLCETEPAPPGDGLPDPPARVQAALEAEVTDLRTLVRERLAGWEAADRGRALQLLAGTAEWSSGPALAESLHLLRQALRERLLPVLIRADVPVGAHVDALLAVDDRTFFVKGWMRDGTGRPLELTAVAPEGARTVIGEDLYRHRRPDVAALYADGDDDLTTSPVGFAGTFGLPAPSRSARGWVFELRTPSAAYEVPAPDVVSDMGLVKRALLRELNGQRVPPQELCARHLRPALTRLAERWRDQVEVREVVQLGTPPTAPAVSVVVPLYKRIDFLEHQLAQFAHDPAMADTDLIYVLDSPELDDAFLHAAAQLHELYRLPFRAVTLTRNGGFSTANNIGASLARSRLLLLCNSDVLPDRPGWLQEMARVHDTTPGVGAVGAKLLYEDDSIQHAGMFFYRRPGASAWQNEHHYKGLHRSLRAADVSRPVAAVSAACLMIETALYREVGGLRGMYLQGDYEDSDLCLRLRAAGRTIWYAASAELYHLEGQSYPSAEREAHVAYNRWLHDHLWREEIEALVAGRDR